MSAMFDLPGTSDAHRTKRTITYAKRRTHDRQGPAATAAKRTSRSTTGPIKSLPHDKFSGTTTTSNSHVFDLPASDQNLDDDDRKTNPAGPKAKSSRPKPADANTLTGAKRKLPAAEYRSDKRLPTCLLSNPMLTSTDAQAALLMRRTVPALPDVLLGEANLEQAKPDVKTSHNPKTPTRSVQSAPKLRRSPSSMSPAHRDVWTDLLQPVQHTSAAKTMHSTSKDTGRLRMVDRLKAENSSSSSDKSDLDSDSDNAKTDEKTLPRVALSRAQSSFTQPKGESQQSLSQGARYTYGGTRSYLKDVEIDLEAELLGPPLDSPVAAMKVGQSSNFVDMADDEDNSQAIRSIHELRAAGVKTLFADDLDALVYDFKAHSKDGWSRRRAALMGLANKLVDKAFIERFYEHSYDDALCSECDAVVTAGGVDTVGDTILMVCLARLLKAPPPRHVLARLQRTAMLAWSLDLVDNAQSMSALAKDRKMNMAKSSQADFLAFMSTLAASELFDACRLGVLTRGAVALACADSIARCLRGFGGVANVFIHESRHVSKLVTIGTTSSDPWLSTTALGLLEADSVAMASDDMATKPIWTETIVEEMARAWPDCPGIIANSDRPQTMLLLRLCLNISNNDTGRCETLGKPVVVGALLRSITQGLGVQTMAMTESPGTKSIGNLDMLLLSLGLLINLVEFSDAVRAQVAAEHVKALSDIVEIFNRGQDNASLADSLEQSHANVAHGYLAVLLGNLCMSDKCKQLIRARLPDADMSKLVKAVMEFVQYHEQVDKLARESIGDEGPVSGWQHFTSRLMAVVDHIE